MAKGRKTGGRQAGTPNKSTADVRQAIAEFAQSNVSNLQKWLEQVAEDSPARALEIFARFVEFHIPKLARQELTGKYGERLIDNTVSSSDIEIAHSVLGWVVKAEDIAQKDPERWKRILGHVDRMIENQRRTSN